MKFTCSVTVDQPLALVAELFADPAKLHHYQEGFLRKELISGLYDIHFFDDMGIFESRMAEDLPGEQRRFDENEAASVDQILEEVDGDDDSLGQILDQIQEQSTVDTVEEKAAHMETDSVEDNSELVIDLDRVSEEVLHVFDGDRNIN